MVTNHKAGRWHEGAVHGPGIFSFSFPSHFTSLASHTHALTVPLHPWPRSRPQCPLSKSTPASGAASAARHSGFSAALWIECFFLELGSCGRLQDPLVLPKARREGATHRDFRWTEPAIEGMVTKRHFVQSWDQELEQAAALSVWNGVSSRDCGASNLNAPPRPPPLSP